MSTETMPDVGEKAPSFSGETQQGNTISLNDYAGKKVALYFYPKDDTPGCTKQACNLRDEYQTLKEAGVEVVGVSADDVESHQKFANKYSLPFPLIADTDRSICEAYGVYGERSLYGRKFMGIKRTTYLSDEEGKIAAVIKRPKVSKHADEVLRKFGLEVN
jgi:thioredoxin-dependent peroxiredoxin